MIVTIENVYDFFDLFEATPNTKNCDECNKFVEDKSFKNIKYPNPIQLK